MKGSVAAAINACKTKAAVDEAIEGIQYAVKSVLTKAEKPAFEAYRADAWDSVAGVFVEADYREAEIARAEDLAAVCQEAIDDATNYAEVDGALADYIVAINALKTKAEWEAEENANDGNNSSAGDAGEGSSDGSTVEEYIPNDDTLADPTDDDNRGCGGVIIGCIVGVVLVAGGAAAYLFLRKKGENDGEQGEEQDGEQVEKKKTKKEKKAAKKDGEKDGNNDEE
jgi:hypothetical protein